MPPERGARPLAPRRQRRGRASSNAAGGDHPTGAVPSRARRSTLAGRWPPSPLPPGDGPASAAGETREKLLAGTHELLYERVGGPVSVNAICARAGVNVAMVKYCFGGKDAMMVALIDRVITGFIRELEKLDRRALSAEGKLRIHVAEIVRNYVRYPYLNRLLSTQLLATGDGGAAMLARDFAVPARDWYRRLLAEGQASGEFRAVDPTLFFFTVIGIAEFFFTAQPLLRGFGLRKVDAPLLDRYIAHVTEIVLRGVQASPHARSPRTHRGGGDPSRNARKR
jgi:AcrR family transcriptional regulator